MSESKHAMKLRHKAELKALQSQPAKGIGAKKKQKEDEEKMMEKHTEELKQLEIRLKAAEISESEPTPAASEVPAEVKVSELSRAQQKKAKKAENEKMRKAAVAEEIAGAPNKRNDENRLLQQQLSPLKLAVKEILSDGHCLFRALADQLEGRQWRPEGNSSYALYSKQNGELRPLHIILRHMAAGELRSNRSNYLPFLCSPESGEPLSEKEFPGYLEILLDEIKIAYGSHTELVALANALKYPIRIFSAEGKPMEIFPGNSSAAAGEENFLQISFHQHYFGLGDHYNSIVKQESEEDEGEEEKDSADS